MIINMQLLRDGWKRAILSALSIGLLSPAVNPVSGGESAGLGMDCPMQARPLRLEGSGLSERAPTMVAAPDPERDLRFIQWVGLPVERSTDWQSLTVEPGEVGLLLSATVRDPGFAVSFEVRGPGGELVACHICESPPAVGEEKESRGTAQIPSTDRPGNELQPGTYRFRVIALRIPDGSNHGDSSTIADVLAAVRGMAAEEVRFVLDLNFIYLPGIPLNATIAQSTPEFEQLLIWLSDRIAPLGIELGTITHVDLNRPEFTHLSSWAEAGQMMRTSTQAGRQRALNVFCVGIFDEDFLNVGGLSGGIPGAAVNGTQDSGIAIRIAPSYPNFLEAYPALIAHEIGHYLGLYHTTEANLERADPLSDTPRCNEPDLRACPDWNYYMFPVTHFSMRTWSDSQIRIVQTHPLVRTIPVVRAVTVKAPQDFGAGFRASPNPFSQKIEILGVRASDRIEVFDVSGRRVRVLESGGTGARIWDGLDQTRHRAPAGTYFLRIGDGSTASILRIVRIS